MNAGFWRFRKGLKSLIQAMLAMLLVISLAGCETFVESTKDIVSALPDLPPRVDDTPIEPNWVQVTGYAPISLQEGQTQQHKVLMAMKASKLDAYRELTALVHGQYLAGTTSVKDMVLQNNQFQGAVAGIVRGARVVKSYPVQTDVYATILEIDLNQVQRAWQASQ
ncbi:hypothetical protein SAMN03080615_03418 [Amphritea atlantica]|uniref:LPP20 lipoprotein n=1 Tax=Amphritea atlantica TaxID=355243 RepID=A0A1H9KBH5_9GAMM|nr:hypothetical protein [Amphritea atlantica]SEQ96215.1 hypothetical protein SAMN03080615_03418 [Amphritea atlantica]